MSITIKTKLKGKNCDLSFCLFLYKNKTICILNVLFLLKCLQTEA